MCEMSIPVGQTVTLDVERAYEQMLDGLVRAKILDEGDRARVVSRYHRLVRYSYPIPTLGRDGALAILQPALAHQGIYSRGRFGAWRYEIGNMDHSVMMGVEVADHVVSGGKELVFYSL
jgi:protoporphyrinogen oxidase